MGRYDDFLDLIHLVMSLLAVVAIVAHMNAMTWRKTPALEIFGWWLLGLGMSGEFFWHVWWFMHNQEPNITIEHFFLTVGGSLLVFLYSQPEWRPYIAERRKNTEIKLPPDCDRRCQNIMGARKVRKFYDHA